MEARLASTLIEEVNISVFVDRSTASQRLRRVKWELFSTINLCGFVSDALTERRQFAAVCWWSTGLILSCLFVWSALRTRNTSVRTQNKRRSGEGGSSPIFFFFISHLALLPFSSLPLQLLSTNEPFPVFFRLIYGRAACGAEDRRPRDREKRKFTLNGRWTQTKRTSGAFL